MSVWTSLRAEYRFNFGSVKRFIPIFAILFIPIIYAGTYLWAFWDPYGRVNNLPVAVVNEDQGAIQNGKRVDIGQQLVNQLKTNTAFHWDFVSPNKAQQGMDSNQYFMVLKIPPLFSSQTVNAANHAKAVQPKLIITTNDKANYIASLIGKNGAEQIRAQTAEKIAANYATSLVSGTQQLEQGILHATQGAKKIAAGSVQLGSNAGPLVQGASQVAAGSGRLVNGIGQATTGAAQVAQGTQSAAHGASQLNQGLGQLVTSANSLSGGANQTLQGITQLGQGLQKTQAGAVQTSNGAAQLATGLQQFANANPALASNPDFQKLVQASQQVAAGTAQVSSAENQLVSGASQLQKGQASYVQGMNQFVTGLQSAKQGSQTLSTQMPALVTGAQKVSSGLSVLKQGATQVQTGTNALNSGIVRFSGGVTQLKQGATQLSNSLQKATTALPNLHAKQLVNATSNPVGLVHIQDGKIPNYGYGLAPYFMSLGLYVGALMMSIVIQFREPAKAPKSGIAWFFSKLALIAAVGIVQALILDVIMIQGLGIHVENVSDFVLFSILTSLTFVSIIQLLVSALANPGRFLAVILLVLQLTSTSGSFPVILSPKFFQTIHPFLPMTYTIEGFRFLIGGGDVGRMQHDIFILIIFAVTFMVLTLLYFTLRFRSEDFEALTEPQTAS